MSAAQRHYPAADGPAQALRRLLAGNERYASGRPAAPNRDADRRSEVSGRQHPFVVVFGCADSRVPPELVFDCGLGDVLAVRTAGHVVDRAVLGTLQFGVVELEIPLIVVLGHQGCGAVTAALEAVETGGHPSAGEVGYLTRRIEPAVLRARRQAGDPVDNTVRANAVMVAERLVADPVIGRGTADARLQVVSARYDLATGRVELLQCPGPEDLKRWRSSADTS